MSLKSFHIVFVTVVTLLFLLLSIWSFVFAEQRTPFIVMLGWVSAVCVVLTQVYGVYFLRKAQSMKLA
jgi:hypothetical protein